MDSGSDIGTGDVGQDMGLWTVWVTGDRCLALVTCYNGLLQQGTNSGQTRRPIFFVFYLLSQWRWSGTDFYLAGFLFVSIHILSPILNTFTINQYGPNSHLDVLGFV